MQGAAEFGGEGAGIVLILGAAAAFVLTVPEARIRLSGGPSGSERGGQV